MLLVAIFKIEIWIVTRCLYFRALNFRIIGAAHRFRKSDKLCFFFADRPIVSITAERDDPLFGIGTLQQNVEPALEPRARAKRPRGINVRRLVKQHRHKTVDVVREIFEVDVIQLLPGLNTEPELLIIVMERVGKFVDESRSEEHTSELQSHSDLVCRLLLE